MKNLEIQDSKGPVLTQDLILREKSFLNLDIERIFSLRITSEYQRTEKNEVESSGLLPRLPKSSLTSSRRKSIGKRARNLENKEYIGDKDNIGKE